MLTRRELLAGAGSAAAALALAGCGGARRLDSTRPAATALGASPDPAMRKGISLIGDVNAYDDTLGVRPYLLDGPHPATRPSVPLDPSRDPATGGAGYPDLGQDRLPHDAHLPDDLGSDGPWAWLVAYLCRRYSGENPAGARIDWLAPLNEPNLAWWPQRGIAAAVEQLVRSAETAAAERASAGGPGLLLPGTSDVVASAAPRGTPWDAFSDELLARLRGWRPRVPVGWAHHNYADVKHGPLPDGRWRVERLLDLQRAHDWPDPSVWLTEGGYQFGVRRDGWAAPGVARWVVDPARAADSARPDAIAAQVAAIERNWAAMARLPVRLWTQYQVNDRDVAFQSSLRGPVRQTPAGRLPNDPPYPAYARWPLLVAT